MAHTETEALTPIPTHDLTRVSGGAPDPTAVGGQIGGLVDSFTDGNGEGAQIGSQIGSLVKSFL